MTAPQIIERALTFKFAQSVSLSTGRPDVMEVAIIPLDDASSAISGATFAGGLKSETIELSQAFNLLTFKLVPSFSPGLQAPIQYRVMWRAGITSRTYTFDFAMPDADLFWDQLVTLGNVIDGEAYLQITDLGVPGRVARLDSNGHVVDSSGVPVATGSDITTVTGLINTERVERQAGDSTLRSTLETELNTQVASTLSTANIYTNNKIISVNADLTTERSARQGADTDLQTQINTKTSTLQAAIDSLAASTGGTTDALSHKADLDNTGHVPLAQLPDTILTNAFGAADQAAMLALSPSVVHKGSVCIRPDGVWLLTAADPTVLSNWVSLTTVNSVNSKRGAVVLTATDVGAIPTGGSIASSQVTGLSTALSSKANQSDLTTLTTQLQTFVSDPTLVHTTSGVVPISLMDTTTVFINSSGQLVKKDGTIIPISGGGGSGAVFSVNAKTGVVVLTAADVGAMPTGSAVTIGQVTGLSTVLGNKADLDLSGKVPIAQVPSIPQSGVTGLSTSLSTKADLVSGLVPLVQIPTIPQAGVAGLAGLFTNNQITNSSNAVNRIASLESSVAAGGGGGGGGATIGTTATFYTAPNTTTAVTDLSTVILHSPWGIDSDGTITGTTGTWYYLYTGVRGQDVAYPYFTPNGHLSLRKWNESNPSDPAYATQTDLTALTTTVGTKANGSDLTALTNVVATKANSSDLTTLSTRVDTKAAQADLNATNTAVASKATASDLANLATLVGLKANQSALDTTNTAVAARALQTDLTALTTRTTTIETALPTKADLSGGVLVTGQVPNIAQSKITGLTAALAGKADLSGGALAVGQIPTNIPQSSITGLGTALGNKADLVAGVIPLSQIPLGALPNVQVVANRAAMLALTLAQVQFGDLALITGTGPDKGTYILSGNDPSVFSNWTPLTTPDAPVVSVNGQTGTVVLDASSVGALASSASIPQSQITGLTTALASFATSSSVVSGLAGKASLTDVQNQFYLSSMVKRADYVATSSVSLSGQQTVDGVLMVNGSIVLCTNQSASSQNGLWTVNGGAAWTRPPDYATTSWLARDTVVFISNTATTNPGSFNYSLWQAVAPPSTSGYTGTFIDSGQTAWKNYGYVAPPFVPVAGNGIGFDSATKTFTATAAATVPNTGGGTALAGGLTATSTGMAVDPASMPRKYLTTLNVNASTMTVTHNLNTTTPVVSIWDTASNSLVLVGITVANAQSISIEFGSPSGQYRVCVVG